MTPSRMYSLAETSTIIGIPYSTLRAQVRAGKADHLRPLIVGPKIVFPKKLIDDLAEGTAA